MALASSPELLVLHAVRILGVADTATVARRFRLTPEFADEVLLDDESFGWVQRSGFADLQGWSLTERGRAQNERMLAAELDGTGGRAEIDACHRDFVALNGKFLELVTRWQLHPQPGAPMAANDHSDWAWDEEVLKGLTSLGGRLRPLADRLAGQLHRFDGYPDRFDAALRRVDRGERSWIDAPRIDSCHTVWFELHEDLLATLGIERGGERATGQ